MSKEVKNVRKCQKMKNMYCKIHAQTERSTPPPPPPKKKVSEISPPPHKKMSITFHFPKGLEHFLGQSRTLGQETAPKKVIDILEGQL